MSIRHKLRKLVWKLGYDVSRATSHALARRKLILETRNVDVVLDIGANSGQFAEQLRSELGYSNRIVSFEPLSSAFEILQKKARHDSGWRTINSALGDVEGKGEINVSGNSYSSSLLDILPSHVESAPDSKYISKETIEIKKLDDLFDDLCEPSDEIYMKIDTQGFESKVVKGAENSLKYIDTIQLEMSLVPLYEGESRFIDIYTLMTSKGYSLVGIESGFSDPTSGQLLQIDGIFQRL